MLRHRFFLLNFFVCLSMPYHMAAWYIVDSNDDYIHIIASTRRTNKVNDLENESNFIFIHRVSLEHSLLMPIKIQWIFHYCFSSLNVSHNNASISTFMRGYYVNIINDQSFIYKHKKINERKTVDITKAI